MQANSTSTDRRSYSNIARAQVRNESKTLYTNSDYSELLDHPRELKAWRRSFNSKNVVFYTQPNIDKITFLKECIKQIGQITAVTHMRNKRKENSYEVLFESTSSRDIALTTGFTINNVQLIAQPILDPNVSLTKVNLYGIPNASLDEIIKPIGEALSAFGKVAQIRAYLIPDVHVFDGQATVLLDTRSDETNQYQPLSRQIHLGYDFDCFIQARWKDMPPFCRYCRQEGHLKKDCNLLDQAKRQQKNQQSFQPQIQQQQQPIQQPIQQQVQAVQIQQQNDDQEMDYSPSGQQLQPQPQAMDISPSDVIDELSPTISTLSNNNNTMITSDDEASFVSTETHPNNIDHLNNNVTQQQSLNNDDEQPYTTRSGRVVQPPRPYSPSQYN